MADKRIKDLPLEAELLSGDFAVIDSLASGTRKVAVQDLAPFPSDDGPLPIAAVGDPGVGSQWSRADHAHEGVRSVEADGAGALDGDITITAGPGISTTTLGNDITITALSGGGFTVVPVLGGGAPFAVAPVTAQLIAVDSTGGVQSIVLPVAPPVGTAITVKDSGGVASANPITIVGTIDGAVNYLQNVSYSSFTFVFIGAQWSIV